MIQKIALSGLVTAFLFLAMVFGTPSSAAAEEPSVVDWLNEDQPDGKTAEKQQETNDGLNDANEQSPILLIGQLIFYTLLILVMIYALIKFLASRQKKLQPNQAIHLIGGSSLGNNKSLQLVKVGGKVYLLGVADQITLIKEFSNEDEISNLEADPGKPEFFSSFMFSLPKKKSSLNQNGDFDQLFNQSLNKQKEKQSQLEQDLFRNDEKGGET